MSESSTRHDGGGEAGLVLTADAIAVATGGRVIGDAAATVSGIAPLDRAGPHDLSFLATAKYTVQFAASRAGVVLVSPALAEAPGAARARVLVDNPHDALLALVPRFHPEERAQPGVHPTASIARGVQLGRGVRLGPYVVIGENVVIGDDVLLDAHVVVGNGVTIGAGSHLYPGVVAYAGTQLGCRVTLHAGVRAGSDGFGYVFRAGRHEKIPHIGRCIIEDDVEIGANTTVDRGSIDDTVIGAGTKIDNLVQIGHNVRIGRCCLIVAQAGIAGSTHLEDGAVIGGQVGISGHVVIGAGARVAAQGGVFGDVPAGETWSGYPARPHAEALRAQAALFRLPKLLRRLERLLSGDA